MIRPIPSADRAPVHRKTMFILKSYPPLSGIPRTDRKTFAIGSILQDFQSNRRGFPGNQTTLFIKNRLLPIGFLDRQRNYRRKCNHREKMDANQSKPTFFRFSIRHLRKPYPIHRDLPGPFGSPQPRGKQRQKDPESCERKHYAIQSRSRVLYLAITSSAMATSSATCQSNIPTQAKSAPFLKANSKPLWGPMAPAARTL